MRAHAPYLLFYQIRGLPACGKSFTARQLAGETGIVLETDEYFYSQVGSDPTHYDFREDLLPAARQWVFERLRDAISRGITPIVLDRGNGLNAETRAFAALGIDHEYSVKLTEPDSPWWQELRVLLKYRDFVSDELFDQWAGALADKTRRGHQVPASTIRRWMSHWRHDVTAEEILACEVDTSQ